MGATLQDDVTKLKRSSQGRAGNPDGNIYFGTGTGVLEIIIASEMPYLDAPANSIPNTLTLDVKPTLRAIYELEVAERVSDPSLRRHEPFLIGRFNLGKAFDFLFGRNAGVDRDRIGGTGWREFDVLNANINRIYFNVSSLQTILDTTQVIRQKALGAATFDFARPGVVDEAYQVFGTTAYGDTGAGTFSDQDYLAVSVASYGQRHQRVTLSDFGINKLEGYGALAALGEAPHPTTSEATYPLADVYGGSQVSPWTGLSFESLASPETRSGFNEADGDFSLIIRNTNGASLDQVVAWCDATNNQNSNIASVGSWNGKNKEQLYSFDADGVPNFIYGVAIDALPDSDKQRLAIFADNGDAKTFPFAVEVRVSIPIAAIGSATGVYEAFIVDGAGLADYGTNNAVTLVDNLGNPVVGTIGASSTISFGISYDTFSQAGLTGPTNFSIRFLIISDGEFEEAFTTIDITRAAIISASLSTNSENNI